MTLRLDKKLSELKSDLINMGTLAAEAVQKSIEALKNRDAALARKVIEDDDIVDRLELVIDAKCIDLIARFQPMAKDVRFITMVMKINSELERIADIAVDIAERGLEIVEKPLLKPLIDIPKLSVVAQEMVRLSIEAFVQGDVHTADRVREIEPESDKLRDAVQVELIDDFMSKDASTAPRAIQLLLIARYLERVCDHATNIAEEVTFLVDGEVVKHSTKD